jgi:hypothetical protein
VFDRERNLSINSSKSEGGIGCGVQLSLPLFKGCLLKTWGHFVAPHPPIQGRIVTSYWDSSSQEAPASHSTPEAKSGVGGGLMGEQEAGWGSLQFKVLLPVLIT